MPLPENGTAWPPRVMAPITQKQREFDAWYSGEPGKLSSVYRTGQGAPVFDRVSQYRGGVQGAIARMWWGRPTGNLLEQNTQQDKLHIPLAADLCQASADLLYSDAPSFGAGKDKETTAELDLAVERGLVTTLAEGNEIGAALGDSYFRVTWDDQLADRSFLTTVHADAAWPEFRWGVLTAVTFWWKLDERDGVVLRHVERHELNGTGLDAEGVVFHGLFQGTSENLGQAIPLTEHTATTKLADLVNAEGFISTQSPGLAVVHIPNQTPQRQWRQHPIGRYLGRSDLSGVEPELDKLDMVWSSWMRDIRLAKARLIVPNFMLSSNGPGQGAMFDTDQDIFTSLNAPPREDGRSDITPQQFDIRVEQHMKTAEELIKVVLRTAGYGEQTFGEGGDMAKTATEVDNRDRRSNMTRDRKIRNTEGPLTAILRKKLAVDRVLFRSKGNPDADLEVDFPPGSQQSPESLAQTNALLFAAQSASAKVRVSIQHPDWDEKQITDETAAILAEFGTSVPDPTTLHPPTDQAAADAAAQAEADAAAQAGA